MSWSERAQVLLMLSYLSILDSLLSSVSLLCHGSSMLCIHVVLCHMAVTCCVHVRNASCWGSELRHPVISPGIAELVEPLQVTQEPSTRSDLTRLA
jgi:hypothetical protein